MRRDRTVSEIHSNTRVLIVLLLMTFGITGVLIVLITGGSAVGGSERSRRDIQMRCQAGENAQGNVSPSVGP